ncbi:HNH endonuclease [Arcanobacterium canis]
MAKKRVYSRRFQKLAKAFFDQGKAEDAPCWICGQPIDYDAKPGTTDTSHELDHYYPVSTYAELQEDPSNFLHSHRECNRSRGNRLRFADLGETHVANWW